MNKADAPLERHACRMGQARTRLPLQTSLQPLILYSAAHTFSRHNLWVFKMPVFQHRLGPSVQPHIPATHDAMANTVLPPSSSDRVTRQNGEATFAQPVEIGTSAALSPASNGQATFSQPVAVHGVSHSSKPSRPPRSSHFRLTELPLELLARVLMWVAQSAYSGPIQKVVDLRLVCSKFIRPTSPAS